MARRLSLGLVLVAVLAAFPAEAQTTPLTVGCSGTAPLGGSATCSQTFSLPHFDGRDSIDYASLVARFTSIVANGWRVEGAVADARGVVYFQWYCDVGRSVFLGTTSFYAARSCEATRRTISGLPGTPFYVADVNQSHTLTITARAASCVPSSVLGCRFEGALTYLIGS